MQQLLTGKTRLKGFTTPWNYIQLGKIGSTFGGLTGKSKYDFGVGNAKYITFLNVLNNPILKCELFENVIIKEGEKQNKCRRGDLFFNTSSETPEEVGICAMLDTEIDNLYLNSFCFGFRLFSEKVRAEYLAYYFRSIDGRKLMSSLAQGVTRYNMSKSAFNKAEILMPSSPEEQHAIYQALRNMDDEIAALEAKRKKYEAVKQGMMQQLLTGKIRLINDKIKVRDE
jgi:type I restriction enzyme S subunit